MRGEVRAVAAEIVQQAFRLGVKPRPEPRVVGWVDATDESLLFLSVLTLGEIRKSIGGERNSRRRAALESWLETALRPRFAGRILAVDEGVADHWAALQRRRPRATSLCPLSTPCSPRPRCTNNLTLVTRNGPDVAGTGVAVLNPWDSESR